MNILVLNGSPKGELSVTLQYVTYLQKKLPAHTFKIVHVSQRIKRLERDAAAFAEVLAESRTESRPLGAPPACRMVV